MEVRINNLFADVQSGVAAISSFAIQSLLAEDPERNPEWVQSGAGPAAENFERVNLTRDGALITFDEYQVGCYAEGPSQVLVPYSVIRTLLNPLVADSIIKVAEGK